MPSLKDRVHDQISTFMPECDISDHTVHTADTIESQRDFLRRVVVERSDNPLAEVDSLDVINDLDEKSICSFIQCHLARE